MSSAVGDELTTSYRKKTFFIIVTLGVWLGATWLGWLGHRGSDDFQYAEYAFNFDRPPRDPWQFRIPAILAIRASYLAFGPSEIAACLPTLLASVAIVASVAWFVNWPSNIDWKSQASVLLACTLPLDATRRSYPGAPLISVGLLCLGTLCVLKGKGWSRYAGAGLLALGFMTHEISFFYVAIFCLTALAFDWRRFWRPVVACVVISAFLLAIECSAYQILLEEPLARYKTAAAATDTPIDYHHRFGGSKFLFFVWPLRVLVCSKMWTFSLIILLLSGIAVWRRLDVPQKILFTTIFLLWFWLGYGTQLPWAYKPRSRAFHYYYPLTLGIAALVPYTLSLAFATRQWIARGLIVGMILVHLPLSASFKPGPNIAVSRDLLQYAQKHKDRLFLTDRNTFREMRILGGYRPLDNVVSVTELDLTMISSNKRQRSNAVLADASGRPIGGILVSFERWEHRTEPDFRRCLEQYGGQRTRISPIRYRRSCVPIVWFIGARDFMLRSKGGEVAQVVEHEAGPVSD